MTKAAAFREADLNRALKVAAKHGYAVKVEGAAIMFLPIAPGAALPSPDQDDESFARGLKAWRRSA